MISLEDKAKIKEIDLSGMLSITASLPEMIEDALALCKDLSLKKIKKPDLILASGMGGSAIGGDLARELFALQIKVPFLVNRSYELPGCVGPQSLVFMISYSGNTEETLSAYREAEKRKAQIICITSGGKLKELALKKKAPLIEIKGGLQPRAALPYLLIPMLRALEEVKLIELGGQIEGCLSPLRRAAEEYLNGEERVNQAKQLAHKLYQKDPLIFCSSGSTEAAGLRFKCQLNENSKVLAQLMVFPELNHNDLVGINKLKRAEHNYQAVLLKDIEDNLRVRKRMDITKSLVGAELGGFYEIESKGKGRLERLLSLVLLGDMASVYLAILKGVDPTPVEIISKLKKELLR